VTDGQTDGCLTFGYSMCINVTVVRDKKTHEHALMKCDARSFVQGTFETNTYRN
jgi:hypothetical protein